MVETAVARNRDRILLHEGRPLHSRYDPTREASRFVEKHLNPDQTRVVVIVGETVGHLSRAALRRQPDSLVVPVLLSRDVATHFPTDLPKPCVADSESLSDRLRPILTEWNVDSFLMLQWPPSLSAWPDVGNQALAAARSAVRMVTGNVTTTAAFGRRWLCNLVRNLLNQVEFEEHRPEASRPILIAASGPSLAEVLDSSHIPWEALEVWALPSSVEALACRGIRPALIITTDAGYYASIHYRSFSSFPSTPVAHPLTAYPIPVDATRRRVLLNQGSPYEEAALSLLPLPAHRVAANGTVAGTALDFALQSVTSAGAASADAAPADGATSNTISPASGTSCAPESPHPPVFLAGLDFAVHGDSEHVRPHPFRRLSSSDAARLTPLQSRVLDRVFSRYPNRVAPGIRTNEPLLTYADWFSGRLYALTGTPVFRLLPSGVAVDGCLPARPEDIAPLIRRVGWSASSPARRRRHTTTPPASDASGPSREHRRRTLRRLLEEIDRRLADTGQHIAQGEGFPIDPATDLSHRFLYLLATREYLDARRNHHTDRTRSLAALTEAVEKARRTVACNLELVLEQES